MNITCLNCQRIRMLARVTGGCATPMFGCSLQKTRRTHLMPGKQLKCFDLREENHVSQDILEPQLKTT